MGIEEKAAVTLLDKGIKVPVKAPLLFRLFGKRLVHIVVRSPRLGTLYRLSLLIVRAGLTEEILNGEKPHQLILSYVKPMTQIAAQAWLNNWICGRVFGGLVAFWFRWSMDNIKLLGLCRVLVTLTGSEAFPNSITLVTSLKVTSPRMSQQTEGS